MKVPVCPLSQEEGTFSNAKMPIVVYSSQYRCPNGGQDKHQVHAVPSNEETLHRHTGQWTPPITTDCLL